MLPKGFEPLPHRLRVWNAKTIDATEALCQFLCDPLGKLSKTYSVRPVGLEPTLPYKARIKSPVHKPTLPQAHL